MRYDNTILINNREISISSPVYFIADIASNHDGDLGRARQLIWLAKEAGADAVKFQHFKASKIVSDYGFKQLKTKISHQSTWRKSVFEIYRQYECRLEWTLSLTKTAKEAKVHFLSTPYDYYAISHLDRYVSAFKIGSGDITWTNFIETIAKKNKPVLLATGASDITTVTRAVESILKYNRQIILLQCNTNYSNNIENYKYINLNVLNTFRTIFPQMLLGLSDHTKSHAAVLGAIALGARVIEKHFTDNNSREGPDHDFSMNPLSWKEMIMRSREIEMALGDGIKRIETNEKETVIIQRRCIRVKHNLKAGKKIQKKDLIFLRPAPENSIEPFQINHIVGKILKVSKNMGDALYLKEIKGSY